MNKILIPTEYDEMVALAQWLDFKNLFWIHCHNETLRNIGERVKLAKIGSRAGVPDILIFTVPKCKTINGVAIEMKRRKLSRTSGAQKAWLENIKLCGWEAFVAKGADDAISQLVRLGY